MIILCSSDSDHCHIDRDGQKIINRVYSHNEAMVDNPAESTECYSSHNSVRDKDYSLSRLDCPDDSEQIIIIFVIVT